MARLTDAGGGGGDLSLQEVIYAGLDALQAAVSLDLCAYLHATEGHEPQLFLAVPSLAALSSERALDLFDAMRSELDRPDDGSVSRADIGGFPSVVVASRGRDSRGVHALGRLGRALEDSEEAVVARLARALGEAQHRLESAVVMSEVRTRPNP